jgi:hypothetical protein
VRKLTVVIVGLILVGGVAQAGTIDLNSFTADPTVTVNAAGTSATITEDANLFSVFLSNDPGLGDPQISALQPVAGRTLMFDWDFTEGSGNDDEFGAFLIDASDGSSIAGFDFFVGDASLDDTSSGSVTWDLTSLVGITLGLQFQLTAYDLALDSSVTISNVRSVDTPPPGVVVPLPASIWMGLGLFGALGAIRRARRRSRAID